MPHNPNNNAEPAAGQARPPKPIPLQVIPENIPSQVTAFNQWVCWRYSWDEDAEKWTKYPLNPRTGNMASSTDPKTWTSFDVAYQSYLNSQSESWRFDGIGLVLTNKNNIIGFDLDHCRDPETGDIEQLARDIVHGLPTYWEISTSGTGLRGFAFGRKPGSRCRSGNVEMYQTSRYLCITDHHLEDNPPTIAAVPDSINAVYAQIFPPKHTYATGAHTNGTHLEYDDQIIIDAARRATNGADFIALFDEGNRQRHLHDDGSPDLSRSDAALMRLLTFFTKHEEQLDRLFRVSAFNRPKWESRADYRQSTIDLAIRSTPDQWSGPSASRNGQPHDEAGDERNASSKSDTPPTTLTDVEQVFRKWLDLPDLGLVHVQLGTIAANLIPDADPVWLMEIGGSGWGKTENLQSASALPFIHVAATLTEAALLSGTPRKEKATDAKGGLLRQMGSFGMLILKDFTSILSMHRDGRAAVLAALREIYDGSWTRHVGVDGGRTLHWSGKIGVIAGVTSTIDRHHTVISSMGERFIFYRLQQPDEQKQAEQGLKNVGKEKIMRAELAAVVKSLFANLVVPTTAATMSSEETQQLIAWARLAARCRSPIERDSYSREIELIPDPEAPVRLAQILLRLFTGMLAVGIPRPDAWKLIRKVTFDCMPAIRWKVLQFLLLSKDPQRSTTDIATKLGYPTETARRALEDLAAHTILVRKSQGKGKPDLWTLSTLARQLAESSPGMSGGEHTRDS